MTYSTGRGGAGNIQYSNTITSHDNHISSEQLQQATSRSPVLAPTESNNPDKKYYYSTGRGGAGNIKSSDKLPSPKLVPQGSNTPQLQSSKFSTGRGGYGNMLKNDDPELARKLQDVDGPRSQEENSREDELYAVTSNKSFSVGRGGFGNVISHTRSNGSKGSNSNNLMTITSHGEKNGEKKGLMNKIKNIFK